MTSVEKAFAAWWAETFPDRDEPMTDYELRIFEAGAFAARDFNAPLVRALQAKVFELETEVATLRGEQPGFLLAHPSVSQDSSDG